MIGRLRGLLIEKPTQDILIECGGVGYEVSVPLSTFYELPPEGQECCLLIHHVVREDAQILYGFISKLERALFKALIKVNGVGPKLALTILSGMSPAEFVGRVNAGDSASLVKLPGVGKKTAERLVIEMQDKVKDLGVQEEVSAMPDFIDSAPSSSQISADAESALIALGYKPADASKAIAKVDPEDTGSVESLIKAALKVLTK